MTATETLERIAVLEQQLVFLARVIVRILNEVNYPETAHEVKKLIDFYEWEGQWGQP